MILISNTNIGTEKPHINVHFNANNKIYLSTKTIFKSISERTQVLNFNAEISKLVCVFKGKTQ